MFFVAVNRLAEGGDPEVLGMDGERGKSSVLLSLGKWRSERALGRAVAGSGPGTNSGSGRICGGTEKCSQVANG